ncbi:hypothetical protein ACFZCU_06855 [Streptomyces canus]|uniref:hypothetical protein n=1 Tax=Streptomyces canus TaxID=58343 RepID=UPI0036ECBDEA
MTTIPPPAPMLPVPLPPFAPFLLVPTFQQTQQEARAALLAGAEAPLSPMIRRHQERVLSRVCNVLVSTGIRCQRLYVLEVAGPIPRVKIGRSNDPWVRIRQHVTEMNRYQYGLVDAHVTDPVDDLASITRAEVEAHTWMGKHYKPITREEFRDADYEFAMLCADIAVQLHQPQESIE